MASGNESRATVLLGDLAPRHETPDRRFPLVISLIVPRCGDLGMVVVVDVVVTMQRLRLTARTDSHCDAGVDVRFADGFLALVAPPEPAAGGQEMVADSLV